MGPNINSKLKNILIFLGRHAGINTKLSIAIVIGIGLLATITASHSAIINFVATLSSSLTANISVDFQNRSSTAYPIPNPLFGLNGNDEAAVLPKVASQLPAAGLGLFRIFILPDGIFPNLKSLTDPSAQVWSAFDNKIKIAEAANVTPILELNGVPTALEPQNQNPPQPNPCKGTKNPGGFTIDLSHTAPMYLQGGKDTGYVEYGKAMAQIVHHIDTAFPGVHPYYEMWNEPDLPSGLCSASTDHTTKINEYTGIFTAAAPAMRAQMMADGHVSPIGINFATSQPTQVTNFLVPLLQNKSVDENIDFITMHNYFHNSSWSNLVADTLGTVGGGASAFQATSQAVRNQATQMRHGANTPILIDEYNGSACAEGCRNDPTTAPVWNSLYVANLLNSVFNDTNAAYGAAQQVPAGLAYWSLSIGPPGSYCMFGVDDAKLDCLARGTLVPYPQYYAYKLFHDPGYLDMGNSAYVVSAPKAPSLYTNAFFTKTKDNVMLINTSATDKQTVNLSLTNTSSSATSATVYTLNKANSHISSQTVPLTSTGHGNYTVKLSISPITTMAVSITASTPPPPIPTATLAASPSTVTSGTASNLTWSSTNTTSCTASGSWSGNKPLSGSSSTGNLTASSTYTLTCAGVGGSVTVNASVTVTGTPPPPPPPPPMQWKKIGVVKDTFQRKNQDGWGIATDGNKWTSNTATPGTSISAGTAQMTDVGNAYNMLIGPSNLTDVDGVLIGTITPLGGLNKFGVLLHYNDKDNWYYAYVDGKSLYIERRVKGVTNALQSVPFTFKAGDSVTVKFKILGTSLLAKAWPKGQTEETAVLATTTDTSLSSGQSGIRIYVSNTSTSTISSFIANKFTPE